MKKITKVEIRWSENDTFQRRYPRKPAVFATLAEAHALLREMAATAPGPGGGYDKTDFRITWEDGKTYEGRYDLHRTDCKQENPSGEIDLADHIRGFLTFYGGIRRPSHMTEENYAHVLQRWGEDHAKECLAFLDKYNLE